MAGMTRLDEAVKMLVIQFNFTNRKLVPFLAQDLGQEKDEQRQRRQNLPPGDLAWQSENCSLEQTLADLEAARLELTNIIKQYRPSEKNDSQDYYVVRFIFERTGKGDKYREMRRASFNSLAASIWQCKCYVNPYYLEGKPMNGYKVVNLSLSHRRPLYDSAGKPIKVWAREGRRKVGETKIPIMAESRLRLVGGSLALVKN
jgi:hypothetical protein